jgi:Ca2+-binding EF-hand superfamily protein
MQDLENLLLELNHPVDKKYVAGLFSAFESDQEGRINFENFNRFIVYDPFP